jgi:hypothetical protein
MNTPVVLAGIVMTRVVFEPFFRSLAVELLPTVFCINRTKRWDIVPGARTVFRVRDSVPDPLPAPNAAYPTAVVLTLLNPLVPWTPM